MTSGPITLYHGTIYEIGEWHLPAGEMRNARGPAAICLTPEFEIAKGYCNAADGGTEEIARLIPQVNNARADTVFDFDKIEKPYTLRYRALQDQLDELEAAWRDGRLRRIERVYRAMVTPRNALRLDAGGRKFWNITGNPGRKQDIWTAAKKAKDAGHDCLIVDNVIDNGSVGLDRVGTTVMVFDLSIISQPELVAEEALTFAEVCGRTAQRLAG
ncbi:hypothetical protein X566_15540 [Afipia sp. P52-10]|uniref:hypothetical protein n=1 Tax=Afipia sp. P52-10 TaxID=1429916 RepID=UPI0003DF3AF1|nr:hypothetical protein [Afipia sp. P52-10]ETR79176.1 hypothetical protein X566_15540 [Afipia sp. P52-10]